MFVPNYYPQPQTSEESMELVREFSSYYMVDTRSTILRERCELLNPTFSRSFSSLALTGRDVH